MFSDDTATTMARFISAIVIMMKLFLQIQKFLGYTTNSLFTPLLKKEVRKILCPSSHLDSVSSKKLMKSAIIENACFEIYFLSEIVFLFSSQNKIEEQLRSAVER